MKILFLGLNYAPEKVGIAVYSTGMCERLAARGHRVTAVVAQPYYPEWLVPEKYRGGWKRVVERGVALLRCPIVVPREPSGAKRVIHHISFALSALFPVLSQALRMRPDVLVTTAPSLIGAPVVWFAARLTGRKCWLHVQDFELEAAFATGLMGHDSLAGRLAYIFQNWILRRFDRVSSISPEMCRKLADMRVPASRIVEFRNWAEGAVVPLDRPSSYRADWSVSAPYVLLYSGNIANKQGIEIVLEAARLLVDRRDIQFVVCGNGANRAKLEAEAGDLGNVLFRDLQPMEQLGELLNLATLHLLPQRGDAADLVLPSKLTNMLASGRPVVATAAPGTGLARELEGCGICVMPGDAVALASAISALVDDPERRAALGRTARERAETVWNSQVILSAFERKLVRLAEKGGEP